MRVPFKRHTDHNFVSQIKKRLMKNWKDRLFLTRISLLTDSSHRQTEQARRLRDSRAYFGVKSAASSARLCAAVGLLRRGSTRLGWNVRHASWARGYTRSPLRVLPSAGRFQIRPTWHLLSISYLLA